MKILKFILVAFFRIICLLIVLVLAAYFFISQPKYSTNFIQKIINNNLPSDLWMKNLAIKDVSLSIDSIIVRNIGFDLYQAKQKFNIKIEEVSVFNLFLKKYDLTRLVHINGLSMDSDRQRIQQFYGTFWIKNMSKPIEIKGLISIDTVNIDNYQISRIRTYITGDTDKINFSDFTASAYDGKIFANGFYQINPQEKIEAKVYLDKIDTNKISMVNQKLKGLLSGEINYKGTLTTVESLSATFDSQSSEIEKTLLKYLMGDVNNNLSFLPFAKLMEKYDFIHLDNLKGKVDNITKDTLEVQLNIDSKQLNLKLNPTVTVNLQ